MNSKLFVKAASYGMGEMGDAAFKQSPPQSVCWNKRWHWVHHGRLRALVNPKSIHDHRRAVRWTLHMCRVLCNVIVTLQSTLHRILQHQPVGKII